MCTICDIIETPSSKFVPVPVPIPISIPQARVFARLFFCLLFASSRFQPRGVAWWSVVGNVYMYYIETSAYTQQQYNRMIAVRRACMTFGFFVVRCMIRIIVAHVLVAFWG